MEKCKSCKHWSLPTDDWEGERYERNGVRPCLKAGLWWEQSYWTPEGDYRARKDPSLLMYVQDGSDYMASLLTDPEFGCVHHEPR